MREPKEFQGQKELKTYIQFITKNNIQFYFKHKADVGQKFDIDSSQGNCQVALALAAMACFVCLSIHHQFN